MRLGEKLHPTQFHKFGPRIREREGRGVAPWRSGNERERGERGEKERGGIGKRKEKEKGKCIETQDREKDEIGARGRGGKG